MRRRKKLGQCFLHDKNILNKLLAYAQVQPQDHILEIGCGEGVLSYPLAQTAKQLTIIELDPHWLSETQRVLQSFTTVRYVQSDALDVTWHTLGTPPLRLIANIPYQISAKVIKQFIAERAYFKDGLIMVQKEFGEKLLAKPGEKDYTSLSVYTQFFLEIKSAFYVSKTCFSPVPKVDSMVISFSPKSSVPQVQEDLFFNLVRSAFWGRRKPLASALKKSPYIEGPVDLARVSLLRDKPFIRGETLTQDEFLELYRELY